MRGLYNSINGCLENKLIVPFLAVFCLLIVIAFVLISRSGYGDNLDNYGMLRSWQEMVANGVYIPSRFQGNLPSELIVGTLAFLFGPLGPNTFSFVMSLFALGLVFYFCEKIDGDWKTSALAIATVAANPFWVNASSTSMDYIHPIPFFLFGLFLLNKQWTIVAAVFFAIAGGIRITFAPMGLVALCWAWKRESDPGRREMFLQSLVVFAVVGCLLYLPVFISSHLQLTFLNSARPNWQGFFGLSVRWAYKLLYLYGIIGTIMVAVIAVSMFVDDRHNSSLLPLKENTFLKVCVLVIAYHLILFLYIPVRIEYLLPVLIAAAGIFTVKNVPSVLTAGLIIAELSYWFVSVDLLKIEHKFNDPCDAVVAVNATFAPHLNQGVLVRALTGNTNELLCLPQNLIERPANINERLPKPIVREPR